jgi:hypothetical protein
MHCSTNKFFTKVIVENARMLESRSLSLGLRLAKTQFFVVKRDYRHEIGSRRTAVQ